MATKGVNPFEKSKKDVEKKSFGREGSKKEEAIDKKMGAPAFKKGGMIGKKKC